MLFKKLISILSVLCLLTTLFPASMPVTQANTSQNFVFPNESYDPVSARITTEEKVTLTGTINNVNASSISYSIYQVVDTKGDADPTNDVLGEINENVNGNIYLDGSSLTAYNVQLFPGLNRITFKGSKGFSEVSDTIYIEYRNGPVLYDLSADLNGTKFAIKEEGTTVLYSPLVKGPDTANISISGKAPNADKVTVEVGNKSWTFSVSSSNNFQFFASPITIDKGKNIVNIKVHNKTQVITTTRELAFYNQTVTFYDINLYQDMDNDDKVDFDEFSSPLELHPNYSTTDKTQMKVKGRIIVPNTYYDDNNDSIKTPHPDANDPQSSNLIADLIGVNVFNGVQTNKILNEDFTYNNNDSFYVFEFDLDIGSLALLFDTDYNLKLTANNSERDFLNQTPIEESTGIGQLTFSLRDASKSFIYDINYLPGYSSSTPASAYSSLTSLDMENANIFSMPVGVEVLIGNPDNLVPPTGNYVNNIIKVNNIVDINGKSYLLSNGDFNFAQKLPNNTEKTPYIYKTVNGTQQKFLRVILEFSKLPTSGTQTINFSLNSSFEYDPSNTVGDGTKIATDTKPINITLIYGPYLKFSKIYDGIKIDDDTTTSTRKSELMGNKLDNFTGEIFNIANSNDIRYADDPLVGQKTVFFYINSTSVNLVSNGSPTKFKIDSTDTENYDKAYNALISGENKIKFVLQTNKNSYVKEIKIHLIPTNIPIIPVPGTDGIFPYSISYTTPKPNDSKFPIQGSIYTTTEAKMNIYGTFDFIDLDKTAANVQSKLTAMTSSMKSNYILQITSPDQEDIIWDLNHTFKASDDTVLNVGAPEVAGLEVKYNLQSQSFSFILKGQVLPTNGTSKVYNILVYNSGLTGPKASYRLEINPTNIPYTVVRPVLPAKQTINQNFVEVVIYSDDADMITINKIPGEKVNFDSDNDGTVDYPGSFKVMVNDLKPGKDTEISFIIQRGDDQMKDSFTIRYSPTNIPGAQYMESMKPSHKLFDKNLTLNFTKGTTLIRKDYNVPEALKNQIFTDHKLLFSIANPEDGVVDRHDFETLPANFDKKLETFGNKFKTSFPTRFMKVSPVYWIDAGMADNPETSLYDPLKYGVDPYQFDSTGIPMYDERPTNRQIIPSQRGTLEIKYNSDIRQNAGTVITIFKYDVDNKVWENVGGVVDDKNNTIKVSFDGFGYYVAGKLAYSFGDAEEHPYGRNEVETIFVKGVMNPMNAGEFGVDYYITRGEFTRMMVKALDLPLQYQVDKRHFDDVPTTVIPESLWDWRYIETAAINGIVRGSRPRIFEPNNYITREQAATIIAHALELKLTTDSAKADKELQKLYKDFADTDGYSKSAIVAVSKKGFVKGSPVDPKNPKMGYIFEPKANLLRADAAIIMTRVMADMKKLPKMN